MKFLLLTTVVVVLALGAASQSQNSPSNANDLGTALRLFIDAFQQIMPCGYPAMNIPVLAPYKLPYYEFNITNDDVKAHGHISNLVIAGLNKWSILGSSYNATTGRFFYDIIYEEFQFLGEDALKEWLLIAGLPVHFKFEGLLNFKIKDMRAINEFSIKPNANGTLELQLHEMNFYIGSIESNCWDKHLNIALNQYLNRWVAEALMMFTEQIQPVLKQLYTKYALGYANWGLSQIGEQELIDAYVNLANEFSSANCLLSGSLY